MSITASSGKGVTIDGFEFRPDRAYDPAEGMWIADRGAGVYRIGINHLVADSYGALAQLALDAVGTAVDRGAAFGSLEAAKFVGPLLAPLSGTVRAVNDAVLADPGLVLALPYDAGWLVEVEVNGPDAGLELLISGDLAATWFAQSVAEHREKGLVAE